jgi:hypothetical protein
MVYLKPVTLQAQKAIGGNKLEIGFFPFRLGRESRHAYDNPPPHIIEKRTGKVPPNNDFYLIDDGNPLHISREHFLIEKNDGGGYNVFDRLSTCGTIVKHEKTTYKCIAKKFPVSSGDTIIVGSSKSPYVFEFQVLHDE